MSPSLHRGGNSGLSLTPAGIALDMRNGFVLQRWNVTKSSALVATAEMRFFAHRTYRAVLAAQFSIWRPSQSSSAESMSLTVTRDMTPTSVDMTLTAVNATAAHLPPSFEGWTGFTLESETNKSGRIGVALVTTSVPKEGLQLALGASDSSKQMTLITSIHSTVDVVGSGDPLDACIADVELAQKLTKDGMLESTHAQAWANGVYNMRSISVGTATRNSLALAQVINASLFYIMASNRDDYPWGLSPGGLASQGYNGHTFWDQESWMYPPVLLLNQGAAKALLEYRYNHRAGAFAKAHNFTFYPPSGYQGLMFPWESAFTGEEACPAWASTGRYEQHITGDIAVAIRQYYYASGDDGWALTRALPLMEGIAAFWVSRAVPGKNSGSFDINGVTPPDEYAVDVNNSAYTNAVAAVSLEFAHELVTKFGGSPPSQWLEVAKGLRLSIPFDSKLGVTLEFDSYHGEKIKQADVTLMSFPLRFITDSKLATANLKFYAGVTDENGPAMTWGAYAAGYLMAGDDAAATRLFPRAHANSQPPFYVWQETPTGGTTNFITGAGGFLGAVGYGYGGIHFFDDQMAVNPVVPPEAEYLRLYGVRYRGSVLDIRRDVGSPVFTVALLAQEGSSVPALVVETADGQHRQPLGLGDIAHLPVNTDCRIKPQ